MCEIFQFCSSSEMDGGDWNLDNSWGEFEYVEITYTLTDKTSIILEINGHY